MTTHLDAPADTTMMGVVHDALRRDIRRVRTAVTQTPPPDADRRTALADHLVWMMDFLHEHHRGEDIGLWPVVRERNPGAEPLLDSMEADHEVIEPRVGVVRAAAQHYRSDGSPAAAERLVDAIDELSEPLLAHLDREENEAMPVVSASISVRDWRRIENKHNVRGKSLARLAAEGHWLADNLDPDRYDVLIHLVPAPMRAIILKGFARRYYTACARRWGPELDCRPTAASMRSH